MIIPTKGSTKYASSNQSQNNSDGCKRKENPRDYENGSPTIIVRR